MGKQLGVSCEETDDEVISKLVALEVRDRDRKKAGCGDDKGCK